MDGSQMPDNRPAMSGQMQPGVTITPGAASSSEHTDATPVVPAPQSPELPAVQPAVPMSDPAMTAAPEPVVQPQPLPTPPTDTGEALPNTTSASAGMAAISHENAFTAGSLAMNSATNAAEPQAVDSSALVSWTASEFISHNKSIEWYGMLLGAAVLLAIILWLLLRDIFSSIVIVVAVALLAGYAARKPRELQYAIHDQGVVVGDKPYPFSNFRSFSIVREAGSPFSSIEFIPLKRFALPLTIYYDPADEPKIAQAIADHVPYEERKRDAIDLLMHRIRF